MTTAPQADPVDLTQHPAFAAGYAAGLAAGVGIGQRIADDEAAAWLAGSPAPTSRTADPLRYSQICERRSEPERAAVARQHEQRVWAGWRA